MIFLVCFGNMLEDWSQYRNWIGIDETLSIYMILVICQTCRMIWNKTWKRNPINFQVPILFSRTWIFLVGKLHLGKPLVFHYWFVDLAICSHDLYVYYGTQVEIMPTACNYAWYLHLVFIFVFLSRIFTPRRKTNWTKLEIPIASLQKFVTSIDWKARADCGLLAVFVWKQFLAHRTSFCTFL